MELLIFLTMYFKINTKHKLMPLVMESNIILSKIFDEGDWEKKETF